MAVLITLLGGCADAVDRNTPALQLTGFTLINPRSRQAWSKDLYILNGKLAPFIPKGIAVTVMDGHGRYLLPGMHDLLKAMWGNASAVHFSKVFQYTPPYINRQMNLFCGVTYSVAEFRDKKWMEKHQTRVDLLDLAVSDQAWAARGIMGKFDNPVYGRQLLSPEAVSATVKAIKKEGTAYLLIHYSREKGNLVGVSKLVMKKAVEEAQKVGLKTVVETDHWNQAVDAIRLGVDAILGMPMDGMDRGLARLMKKKGTAWIMTPAPFMDFVRINVNLNILGSTMAQDTISPEIVENLQNEAGYSDFAKWVYDWGGKGRSMWLVDMKNAEKYGVPMMVASRAGWIVGSFQGYSMHRSLLLMQEAGVSRWEALAAVTTRPADFVGRKVGFQVGDRADFFVVGKNPLKDLANTQDIQLVIKDGRVVPRESLHADYTRRRWNAKIGAERKQAWQ